MKKSPQRLFSLLVLMVLSLSFAGLEPALAKPYAINYAIRGTINIVKGVICLNTPDGRLFHLLMDKNDAAKYDDKAVEVKGKAERADEVDTLKVKSIEIIPEDKIVEPEPEREGYQRPAQLVGNANGQLAVNNVRWDIGPNPKGDTPKAIHGWENVTIDPTKVKNVYMVLKPFAPRFLAAHSLFVFTFEPGGMVSKSGKESKALGLTIEAYKKKGQTYGLLKTMKKVFDVVWILTTWDNYAHLNVHYNSSTDTELIVYPMQLTRSQTQALLIETVKQACVNREGEFYHTTRNNCTNNLVILLNRVLPEDRQLKLWHIPSIIYNHKATMPLSLVKMLKKKKLLGEPLMTVTKDHFNTDIESSRK